MEVHGSPGVTDWVPSRQVPGAHGGEEEEDHPEDPHPGRGAPVCDAADRPAGGERGRRGEAAGRLPQRPQAGLLLRSALPPPDLPAAGHYYY